MRALLISTYDLGRQPFGLASASAALQAGGAAVVCADLSRDRLPQADVEAATFVAFFLPMHTATRLAVPVIERVKRLNPGARLGAFGLYAPLNARLLQSLGVDHVLGAEFEDDLRALAATDAEALQPALAGTASSPARALAQATATTMIAEGTPLPLVRPAVPRVLFRVPDRSSLPPLSRYASLRVGEGSRVVGYTEASRGCKHRCRHCPIVPVYDGRFRIVPAEIVVADVRAQVHAGATHITFGDPDFFNGIRHAREVIRRVHDEFPTVSYDVTIKIEHLLQHAAVLPELAATGCAFVTSAVESIEDDVLVHLEKGHTRAGFEQAVALCRAAGLILAPTFVAFTPWTTLEGYLALLSAIDTLDLVEHVAPIQLSIRLLVTEGSRLLELPDIQRVAPAFDPSTMTYPWIHPDPRVDRLQDEIATLAGTRADNERTSTFGLVWEAAHQAAGLAPPPLRVRRSGAVIPHMSEPWYCCAEPSPSQLAGL